MKAPKQGEPAQVFTLRNTSGKDIRFKGWKLAEVDNYNPDAKDPLTGRAGAGSQRWKERAVYQTEGGKIVCHKLGCSRVPGEVDRGEVLVIDSNAPIDVSVPGGKQVALVTGIPSDVDQAVVEFFGNDPLAKNLLEELDIADVETID